jgi:alkanesulfonate monooxygenase SsuD/methylene tetrahydromethanopterin reductase-like flavin-dependent oxidoreductase (luciferase family)
MEGSMDLGIFDHLDRRDAPLDEFYESRLRLLERYDAAGFYSYHLAEHHATPLGLAPVPGIFLAAATQRTRRIRLGPCVYCLPLYDPLRLVEEICMLDQLSRGRFESGVGRGIVPYEMAFFNLHHLETEVYRGRGHPAGTHERRARSSGATLHVSQGADDSPAVPAAAPAALVRLGSRGRRRVGGDQHGARHHQQHL